MSEPQSVHWYPGHMTRTKRQIEKSLKLVDVAAEMIDARIPISSRNPVLDSLIQNKPRVILMNKSDLADPAQTERWIRFYQSQGISSVALDSRSGKNLKAFFPLVRGVLAERIAAWRAKGMVGRPVRVMVVGVPNVGKSSFINQLSRGGKANVEDRPGVTRNNQWFTLGGGFELLDTPGVLWPKFEDPLVGEHLAFTGAVKDDVIDTEHLATRLLEVLVKAYPIPLKARYKLQDVDLSDLQGYEVLALIGKKRGMLIPGGEVDTERAAITVLDEFRGAKLGRVTLEQAP